jgi:hypothetical protein
VGPRVAVAAAVTVGLFACVPSAAAQGVPDCAPDKALNFTLTSHDSASAEENPPLVATHEVVLQADFAGDATAISMTPSAGAQVVKQRSGSVTLFVPAAATLPVTVSWQQPANPDDPDGSRCAASRAVELPVIAPNPSRAVLDRVPGAPRAAEYFVSFRIEPARTRANLGPARDHPQDNWALAAALARREAEDVGCSVAKRGSDQVLEEDPGIHRLPEHRQALPLLLPELWPGLQSGRVDPSRWRHRPDARLHTAREVGSTRGDQRRRASERPSRPAIRLRRAGASERPPPRSLPPSGALPRRAEVDGHLQGVQPHRSEKLPALRQQCAP